jgi:peroxiredoxin Q/BCP
VRCYGVSVDTPETAAEFAASLGVPFPLLSDASRAVARAYGVLGPGGLASRWTFIVGEDGTILDVDRQVNAGTHGRDLASKLAALGVPLR